MARVVLAVVEAVRAVWMGDGGISWASVVIDADGPVTSCAADGAKACGVAVLQRLLSVAAGWGEISLLRLLRPTVDADDDEDKSRACDRSADDAEGDTDAMGTVS